MPNNRLAFLVALEGSDEGLKRALNSADRAMAGLASAAKSAGAKAAQGMADIRSGVNALGDQITRAKTQLLAFVGISWVTEKATQVVQIADGWNLMVARLKLATAGSREFVAAQIELFKIAQMLGVPLAEVSTLYGKLHQAVRQLGGEQKTAFKLTEAISQALKISGASAQEAQSALLQFGQGLAGTALRGAEFNATVEAAPRLAQALADGLNVPIGRLKKMADQGQLTADIVINALLSQKDKLAAEYAQLPLTVTSSFERVKNAFAQWIAKVDESTGLTQKLARALDWLATNLDTVMRWLKIIAEVGLGVLIYRLIPALITAWQLAGTAAVTAAASTAAAWTTANMSLSAAVATAGLLKTAFAVLAAAVIGWEIGTWLSEKFQIVRQAGVAMVQVLETGIETLKYQWEKFAAIFTGDTMAAATERHQQRVQQMQAIFADMYVDATDAARASQQAVDQSAVLAEEYARRLEAVRQGTQEAVGRGLEALDAAVTQLKSRLTAVEQVATSANQRISEAMSGIAASYQGLTTLVESTLQQQLSLIEANHVQKQALLAQSAASEAEQIRKSTELLLTNLNQQSELRAQALQITLQQIDREGQARLYAAQRQAESDEARRANTLRIENEILAAKQQALAQALGDYQRHIDALNAEANRYLAEVRRIEDEKAALTQSTDQRIRELQRSMMSEYQVYQDKMTQVADLQQKARSAIAAGEYAEAIAYAKQAQDLAAQTAKVVKDGDEIVISQKRAVRTAIDAIRESEQLAIQALEGEGRAHQEAAEKATSARSKIEAALRQTQNQVEQLRTELERGLKLQIDVDSQKLDAALKDLDEAMREKSYLLKIDADLKAAQVQIRELEAQLKDGQTLLVNADTSRAKAALETLNQYAKQSGNMELKLATEKAQASLNLIQGQIRAMDQIRTESQHLVKTNAAQARSEIQSLNGQNTSSTHTIFVRKVEQNASGGLVGAGLRVRHFARGGSVRTSPKSMAFPAMREGTVPGTGDGDTVPRSLPAGSFVLRKAAVRRYGAETLRKMAGIARFASGGVVPGRESATTTIQSNFNAVPKLGLSNASNSTRAGGFASSMSVNTVASEDSRKGNEPTMRKKNRSVAEALKLIELGLKGMEIYVGMMDRSIGPVEAGIQHRSMYPLGLRAAFDRRNLEPLLYVKTLTGNQNAVIQGAEQHWRMAMQNGLTAGVDLERRLIDYMEAEQERQAFFARGGAAMGASDTIPAMLTPGEFVVRRDVVDRLGVGFFAQLNALKTPAAALANRVRGFAKGGLVSDLAKSNLGRAFASTPRDLDQLVPVIANRSAPNSLMPEIMPSAPSKTIRVELANGTHKVNATVAASDEAKLLELLKLAQSRT
jgi:tape measure domain-containing protein